MSRTPPGSRAAYAVFTPITTRWSDNDAYGHINNVQYYSFFDTAVNAWLVRQGLLEIAASPLIGLVVETGCRYHRPLSYPEPIEVGMRLAALGNSSIRYELAVFGPGRDDAAAEGHFVHVYVDRATGRPARLPDALRAAAGALTAPANGSA